MFSFPSLSLLELVASVKETYEELHSMLNHYDQRYDPLRTRCIPCEYFQERDDERLAKLTFWIQDQPPSEDCSSITSSSP